MSSSERLRKTLRHETPDRLCVDFGGTVVTGIHDRIGARGSFLNSVVMV